jgi:DNA-binding XRE family transcriptional regulator
MYIIAYIMFDIVFIFMYSMVDKKGGGKLRSFSPERVRQRRLDLSLTQAQLAMKAGTGREYLIEIEKGRKMPKATMIAKIAYALGVRESYFFV